MRRNDVALYPEYIDQRYLPVALGIAVLLHIAVLFVWSLLPKTEVLDIPVHALNIRLSDGDTPIPNAPKPIAVVQQEMEAALARLMRDIATAPPAPKPVVATEELIKPKADSKPEETKRAEPPLRQFVRFNASKPAPAAEKATDGTNVTDSQETLTRYEQTISMWIQKFKTYPDEARGKGMQGDTVVRIRIDRQGTIRYYILESSTGYQLLDRAAIDMIRRANPVPPVPDYYPKGEMLEFLIPVSFHLQ